MASRQTNNRGVAFTPAEQAHRVWLAGLGALSLSYKRSAGWIVRFVEESRELQARGTTVAFETAADLQAQATGVFAPLQSRIEKQAAAYAEAWESRVAAVLRRFGVPAKRDVDALSAQIAALTRKFKAAR
ncbi:MAG: phasin family protein [Rudaea sp.]